MELQFHRRRGVDPRIQRRRYCRVVGEVGCGRRLGRFDSYHRNVIREALVRPDASRGPPFDRSGAASEFRVNYLLCLVRFSGRKWIEAADGVAGEHVEPRHGLRERLHAEQRAARNIAVVREYPGDERIESVDRRQQTRAGEKSPLEQITTRNAAPRPLADDFPAILARSFGFDDACPGCVWGEIDRHAVFLLAPQCFGAARRVRVTFTNPGTWSPERHATRSGLCFLLRVKVEKRLVSTRGPTRTIRDSLDGTTHRTNISCRAPEQEGAANGTGCRRTDKLPVRPRVPSDTARRRVGRASDRRA